MYETMILHSSCSHYIRLDGRHFRWLSRRLQCRCSRRDQERWTTTLQDVHTLWVLPIQGWRREAHDMRYLSSEYLYDVLHKGSRFLARFRDRRRRASYKDRKSADDVQILFQSIATGSQQPLHDPRQRSEDDDEDLIDVLFKLGETINERRSPKFAFRRRNVLPAAALLPSSHSRDRQRSITM
jgi:hypothetical protein